MFAFRDILFKPFLRAITREFVATLMFMLFSLSSTKWAEEQLQSAAVLLIALCFGLSASTMVYCFSCISSAHMNPAITLATVFSRRMSMVKAFFYLLAQCLGATVGTSILYEVVPEVTELPYGVTALSSSISLLQGIAIELLITFLLVFTVFSTSDPRHSELRRFSGLATGFSVAIGHLFAVPYTGASMNPARSLGPAILTGNWEHHWVYWVGPITGGIIAAMMYECLFLPEKRLEERAQGKSCRDTETFSLAKEVLPDQKPFSAVEMTEVRRPVSVSAAEVHDPMPVPAAEVCRPMSVPAAEVHDPVPVPAAVPVDLLRSVSDCPQYELKLKF